MMVKKAPKKKLEPATEWGHEKRAEVSIDGPAKWSLLPSFSVLCGAGYSKGRMESCIESMQGDLAFFASGRMKAKAYGDFDRTNGALGVVL